MNVRPIGAREHPRQDDSRDGFSAPRIAHLLEAATKLGARRHVGGLRVHERFAVGGMASLHFGWAVAGERLVAVTRVHGHLLGDETFTRMLLDEARLAMHVQHPNVVSMLGFVTRPDELLLVMEYVPGAALAEILKTSRPLGVGIVPPIATAIVAATLRGLHAAHEARGSSGNHLGIVHRDVSPQNILVGTDGFARVVDFGIAKAEDRLQSTLGSVLRGKLPYVSPEQLTEHRVDARSDVYSASVVLWEALTGKSLFASSTIEGALRKKLSEVIAPPSVHAPGVSPALDAIVLRGLQRDPAMRYQSAREMALALEQLPLSSPDVIATALGFLQIPAMVERRDLARAVVEREAGQAVESRSVPSLSGLENDDEDVRAEAVAW
jgi:eukaryotic-like serine/threonine-protein kinase